MDAESQLVVIGIAVVESESTDSWAWFTRFLAEHHPSVTDPGYAIISDRQKGLKNAIAEVLPDAYYRHCSVHLQRNIKASFGERAATLFNDLVYARTENEWHTAMAALRAVSSDAATYLQQTGDAPPEEYSHAFFPGTTFGHTASNIGAISSYTNMLHICCD